jgi:hypothetical protein
VTSRDIVWTVIGVVALVLTAVVAGLEGAAARPQAEKEPSTRNP